MKEGTFFCDGKSTCFRQGKCSLGPQPSLKIKLGSGVATDSPALDFEVLPENILVDTNDVLGSKGTFCLLAVLGTVGSDEPKYVLGNSFLRNYYTVYDMKNQKIGITLDISNRDK